MSSPESLLRDIAHFYVTGYRFLLCVCHCPTVSRRSKGLWASLQDSHRFGLAYKTAFQEEELRTYRNIVNNSPPFTFSFPLCHCIFQKTHDFFEEERGSVHVFSEELLVLLPFTYKVHCCNYTFSHLRYKQPLRGTK